MISLFKSSNRKQKERKRAEQTDTEIAGIIKKKT